MNQTLPKIISPAEAFEELTSLLSSQSVVRRDEPLARRTTLRVGGPADLYVEPASERELAVALQFSNKRKLPVFVLGRGSNLLVKDNGYRGVVVSLVHSCFSSIEVRNENLHCGAGAKLKAVAIEAKRHSLTALEFLEGIPGSIGGALRMNAGAMGSAIFEVVESVRLMDFKGSVRELKPAEMEVRYRSCPTVAAHVALGAVLHGHKGEKEAIEKRMREFSRKRWSSQPAAPSAGCMFKNPLTIPAGKLIEELGLKGTRVGGAMVSLEHGNFLVNDGSASARDVLELIELVRERARAERAIDLEVEVEVIGE